jgi:alpha-glucosidase
MKTMIKASLLLLLFFLLPVNICFSQTYSQGDSLVVFYPASFDSGRTLPSLAIVNEPVAAPGMPVNWRLIPEFYSANGKNCARIPIDKSTDLYGTGEVTGPLKRNNTTISLWNTDNYGYYTDNGKRLYQSHPWILGVRNDGSSFGIIADNTWKMDISLNDSLINFISDGPAFRVIVFEAESPSKVLQMLAGLTGKMELPPLWALGYHQCKYSYYPDSRVREIANYFRSKSLPCDVIWLDIEYMNAYRIFTFNTGYFPDPSGLNDYLHTNKFKSIWMIDPGVKAESGYSVYDQGTTGNYWVLNSSRSSYQGIVWPGECVFPDFTMPATRTWWSGLYPAFMANGIDGIWNDMNEPSVFQTATATMPENNIHRGGGGLPEDTHLRYHNVYGMLMVKATREGIAQSDPDKRPFVLSRSNFLGGQRYAATWTGDNVSSWDYLKMSIPMSLNIGLSGQPFNGPDVGGFIGGSTGDLVGNWMAIGAFYPFFRNHHTFANDQEPWSFGTAIEQVCRIALSRRYKLLPYLYTLFYEASKTGMPVMRPVFFADPKDKDLRKEQEAFLFGDKLLIVPKWSNNPSLPKDTWRSISIAGENSKLDSYQPDVRLRNGSILPVGQLIQSTVDYNTDSLNLLISVDDSCRATGYLYDDAGNGYDYQTGAYLIRNFTAERLGDDSLKITCNKKEGNLPVTNKKYRVGIVTNYDVIYSAWTSDTIIKVALPIEINSTITSPAPNTEFSPGQTIHITADANSDIGIVKVVFYYDDSVLIGKVQNPPYEIETSDMPSGNHSLFAIAWASSDLRMQTYPVKIIVSPLSGFISINESQNILVYPNPADDKVTVKLTAISSEKLITVYNILGKKEYQRQLNSSENEIEIDIKNLKNGVYFIESRTQNSSSTQKLIIQR